MIYIAFTFDEAISHQIDEGSPHRLFWLCRRSISNDNKTLFLNGTLSLNLKHPSQFEMLSCLLRQLKLKPSSFQTSRPSWENTYFSSLTPEGVDSLSSHRHWSSNCSLPSWCLEPRSCIWSVVFLCAKPPCWQRVRLTRNRITEQKKKKENCCCYWDLIEHVWTSVI